MLGEFREAGLHRAILATPGQSSVRLATILADLGHGGNSSFRLTAAGVAIHNLKNVAEQPYCAISTKVRQQMIGSQHGRVTPGLRLPTIAMYQTE